MKHYTDLTEKEKTEFVDKISDDLKAFFEQATVKYQLCDVCLHNAVMMMCENYVSDISEMPSNAKH